MAGSSPLIAIFCTSFPPEQGAAPQRMHHMAASLRDAGYRVEVVSSIPNYPKGRIFPGYRGVLSRSEHIDGTSVQRCWIYPSNSRSALPRALSLLTQALSFRMLAFRRILNLKPALVIVSSPPLPMAAAAVRYFRRAGIPVLLNVSDLWPLSARALGAASDSWVYRLLQRHEQAMYRRATAFSAQSESILAHISESGGASRPQLLLRNLPAPAPQAAAERSVQGSPLRIIYPGLLGHAQGLHALIGAIDWKDLHVRLDLFGEGGESASIEDWIRSHPGHGVGLFAPVSHAALQQRLHDYDAVLVPLVRDIPGAVPSKLFTAGHAGLPVLYSAGGEGAGLVQEYRLGFVNAPGDYNGLAASIRSLLQLDAAARIAWSIEIRRAAQTHFNRERQDAAFLAFVRELLEQCG